MATRGRTPKPTALRVLTGNPGKRPLPTNEPQPPASDPMPACPSFVTGLARKHWRELAPQLVALGLLKKLDEPRLALYCVEYGRWREALRYIKKRGGSLSFNGQGALTKHPYVSIANEALEHMLRIGNEFGMSPASRTRLAIDPGENEVDPMEAFLKQRAGSGAT